MPTNTQGPMDVAGGLAGYDDSDQSDFGGVPGHESPMHPGFAANKHKLSGRTHSKHKAYMREQDPDYPGGSGGADGTM